MQRENEYIKAELDKREFELADVKEKLKKREDELKDLKKNLNG